MNVQRADNNAFVGNLADFLVTGERELENAGNETGDDADSDGESEGEVVTVTVGPDGEPVFEPQVLEIEPGTTVRFEWDSGGHNLAVVGQPDEEDMIGAIIVGNPGPG